MVAVGHIHGDQEGWCGHKDQLETPEADMGHWEELIITDVFTARLGEKSNRNGNQHHHTAGIGLVSND